MIVFPNCKINLGLHVTAKRDDGFHDLETVFYPLGLQDALELIPSESFELTQSGIVIPGPYTENIIYRAWKLLRSSHPHLSNYKVHLHKVIPTGAGLGGGSADGSCILQTLGKELGIPEADLLSMALQLGSDCPFFLLNKPCAAKGRGEVLEPLELDLSSYHFVVIHPGIHVSTREAFSRVQPQAGRKAPALIIKQPIESWKEKLFNDFEISVGQLYPEVLQVKEILYAAGAIYASMSGSGSAVYGIFRERPELSDLPAQWKLFHI